MDVLWDKMVNWEKKGFCERVEERPFCCNPMSVVSKVDLKTGEMKKRPCMDFSRHINKYIEDQPVKISHLAEAEKLLEAEDFMTSFDLENMYMQLEFNEKYWKYQGCSVTDPEGNTVYFIFKVLIYGLKSAVYAVTQLTKPIVKKAALLGIRLSIMIDDGRILGRNIEESRLNHDTVLHLVQKAGWNIQWKKTVSLPTQSLYHQGMITSTKPLMYILPDFKMKRLRDLVQWVLMAYEDGRSIDCIMFARMIGSIVSAQRALGPLSRILLRSSHAILNTVMEQYMNWERKFKVPSMVAKELELLYNEMPRINGQAIILGKTGVTLGSLLNMVENR